MEFLMSNRYVLAALLILGVLFGCAPNKKLSRDRGPFEPHWPGHKAIMTGNRISPGNFNGKLDVVYEKKIKGSVEGPILVDGKYVGFSTTHRRFILLDWETGKKVFRFKSKKGEFTDPIIDDSLLILIKHSDPVRLQIVNLFSGKVIRERKLKNIRAGSINVIDDLIVSAGAGLTALDRSNLETIWKQGAGEMVDTRPVSDGSMIYFVSDNRHVQAVRADSGTMIWDITVDADVVSPLTLGQHLYLGDIDGWISALDTARGEIVWKTGLDYPSWSGAAEFDNLVYVGCNNGIVYCLAAENGSVVWQYETDGIVTAPPVVYGDAVLIGSQDRHLYSLDRLTGELLDRRRLEGAVTSAVAVHDGRVFVGCRNNRIYLFEAK